MRGLYRFNDFEVDALRRELRRDGEVIPLSGKPFDVLLALIERAGQVVSKDALLNTVWPNSFVEEANLTQSIFVLRKALGNKASGTRYIVTVPGRGYQLAVVPEPVDPPPAAAGAPRDELDRTPGTARWPLRTSRTPFLLMGALLGVAALAAAALWHATRPAPFSHVTVRQLTNSGDLRKAAIAPSGRYLAWASRSRTGQESISASDLMTGSSRVLLQTDHEVMDDLAISTDEGYVYYRSHDKNTPTSASNEHRIPLLGGEPALVASRVDGAVTFLDGGKRICFARKREHGGFSFLSADADDGSNEKVLANVDAPAPVTSVCSTDGERAILSAEVGGISTLDFGSGRSTRFFDNPEAKEIFADLAWTRDSRALVTSSVTSFSRNFSLGYLSYPGHSFTRVTHDLDSYRFPSITADGKKIVALHRDPGLEFRSLDLPLPGLGPDSAALRWSEFLGWWNDDTLVGTTADGGLKFTDVNTGQERPLPKAHGMQFLQPNGCGQEGVVAAGMREPDQAITIWFVQPNGSGPRQLTHGREDILPACTSDAKWVVYADNSQLGAPSMYRVSVGGGHPMKIGGNTVWFAVSFRTHQLAWFDKGKGPYTLVIDDLDSGRQTHSLPLPPGMIPSRGLSWTPDDRHLFFVVPGDKADGIWECGLDGSAPMKVVEVPGHQVATVLTSPGGKRLGFVTSRWVSDAVLIQDVDR